jgi:hypothetical protein
MSENHRLTLLFLAHRVKSFPKKTNRNMESEIAWKTDDEGRVIGPGFHDGYFYGALQEGACLSLYVKSYDGHKRKIELSEVAEMNITDFWIGSIVGDVCFLPLDKVPPLMWENLFAGRIALHNREASLRKLIETTKGRYFFALEASYGANVYAVCDAMEITGEDKGRTEGVSL